MIVMSMKWTIKKLLVTAGAVVASIVLIVVMVAGCSSNKGEKFVVTNTAERVAFLKEFGLEADPESEVMREVVIPQSFDELFESYNALQKKSGFDLEDYKGKTVQKYTYIILNYPSAEKGDIIKADLLVFEDRVIGGDVYSPKLDGFITGLKGVER